MKQFSTVGRLALVCGILLNGTWALATEPAPTCVVKSSQDSGKTMFENKCTDHITILYCSTTRKIVGDKCGDNKSKHNPYYTNLTNLKPGDRYTFIDAAGHRYAICRGKLLGWGGLKGEFESALDGSYKCLPPATAGKEGANDKGTSYQTKGRATDIGQACQQAQQDVKSILGKVGPCHCTLLTKDSADVVPAYQCTATTDLSGASAAQLDAIEKHHNGPSVQSCPQGESCKSRYVGTGVRG